jgi:hypothetical protein
MILSSDFLPPSFDLELVPPVTPLEKAAGSHHCRLLLTSDLKVFVDTMMEHLLFPLSNTNKTTQRTVCLTQEEFAEF